MPNDKKHPVIKPKASMRVSKKFRNRKPDDEGKVFRGKGNNRKR